MEKSKLKGNLIILRFIGPILGTWMGYIILSVTGFSSSRREVGVYDFITCILFLRITFVKKVLLTITCFMSGVNNAHWFFITDKDAFPGNKSYSKAVKRMFQVFQIKPDRKQSKGGTEFVQACDGCCMLGFCAKIVLGLFSLLYPGLNYLIM